MKYFSCADIHGDWYAFLDALERAEYDPSNPNHQLVIGGDYFGRSAQHQDDCVNLFNYLVSDKHVNKPICIRGNHESILLDIFKRGWVTDLDVRNGEHVTISSFGGFHYSDIHLDRSNIAAAKAVLEPWIESLPWYFETKNCIWVHGFPIYPYTQDLKYYNDRDWYESSWARTPDEVYHFKLLYPEGLDKHLFVGHWHAGAFIYEATGMHDQVGKIYTDEQLGITYLDCCTALAHRLEIAIVEDEPLEE